VRDFPVFTTEYGVASLVLREVPYRGEAYITVQSALQPEELLQECISFCRICGAEKIYARGHEMVASYPLHCAVYEMRGSIEVDEEMVESLWPVTAETVGRWREFLNEKLRPVDNSSTLTGQGEREILEKGGAYFVHRDGLLLGAGWLADGELLLLAAARSGAGEWVLHTLLSATRPEQLRLEVASTNHRAIRFYERMGLVKTAELRRWYQVF